ncbi:hypothetical protein, partial [Klebsiella pneumoniae]|uniref:hypothetical protein n=1 Tax=Klebsiella pneumoniae TaxID=573 RepID=UPI00272F6F4C
ELLEDPTLLDAAALAIEQGSAATHAWRDAIQATASKGRTTGMGGSSRFCSHTWNDRRRKKKGRVYLIIFQRGQIPRSPEASGAHSFPAG